MTPERRPPAPSEASRIQRGDIYWIAPDAVEDPDAAVGADAAASVAGHADEAVRGPAHPHVVVQDDVFNHSRIATVVVCALTTNLHRASEPGNVLLDEGEGELPRRSVVVVSQISSVAKARLGGRIGSLSAARVEQVLAGLRFQQASFFR